MEARPKILVVDDDPDILQSLRELLEDEGYAVETARNGLIALGHLDAGLRPALIIMDFMMPHMDGHTFRREQLARQEVAATPIFGLTARSDVGPEKGDNFHVVRKPASSAEIMRAVRALAGEPTPATVQAPTPEMIAAREQRIARGRRLRRAKVIALVLGAAAPLAKVIFEVVRWIFRR